MSTAVNTRQRPTKDEFQRRFTRMYQYLSDQIRSGKIPPGTLLPSEKQLSSDFHLSRVSVRKVMSLLTSQKLITKAQGKGSIVGEVLPNNELDQVCMILATSSSEHVGTYSTPARPEMRAGFLIGIIERQLVREGIKAVVVSPSDISRKTLNEQLDFLKSCNICAIISIYNEMPEILEFNRCAAASGVNVLALNSSKLESCGVGVVTYDNYSVGRIAAEHLLANGHRVLASIGTRSPKEWEKTRIMAFSDACKASRADIRVSSLATARNIQGKTDSESWYEVGYKAVNELLVLPDVTGVFCINDAVAQGLYDALIERGRKVPEDISIIACDNNYDYLATGLTTISLECFQAGKMAAEIIVRRLRGEKAIIWPELHLVKPLLIPRKTVRNLNIDNK